MTIKEPLISVMMPTYNNAKYISQAIESIYAQNYSNMEIIVVDDGSTDNTKEILKQYKDIKYFYTEHKGIPFARNIALENSKGEYIAFLDSDDYWLPNKLNTQMQYFKEHPDCEIVFTKYENFFENEHIKKSNRAIKEKEFEQRNKYYLVTCLVTKNLFTKCGRFGENFKTAEDVEFIHRLSSKGVKLKHIITNVFYMRRLHGNNITLTKTKENINEEFRLFSAVLRKGLEKK